MDQIFDRIRAVLMTGFDITVGLLEQALNRLVGLLSYWMFNLVLGELNKVCL